MFVCVGEVKLNTSSESLPSTIIHREAQVAYICTHMHTDAYTTLTHMNTKEISYKKWGEIIQLVWKLYRSFLIRFLMKSIKLNSK